MNAMAALAWGGRLVRYIEDEDEGLDEGLGLEDGGGVDGVSSNVSVGDWLGDGLHQRSSDWSSDHSGFNSLDNRSNWSNWSNWSSSVVAVGPQTIGVGVASVGSEVVVEWVVGGVWSIGSSSVGVVSSIVVSISIGLSISLGFSLSLDNGGGHMSEASSWSSSQESSLDSATMSSDTVMRIESRWSSLDQRSSDSWSSHSS